LLTIQDYSAVRKSKTKQRWERGRWRRSSGKKEKTKTKQWWERGRRRWNNDEKEKMKQQWQQLKWKGRRHS